MVSSQSDTQYRESYDTSDRYSNGLHVSPDLAPLEPLLEVRPGKAKTRRVSPSGNKRSVGAEILRLFVCGLIIAAIGGAAFAVQYGDDSIREALGFLQSSVSGLSPDLGANPSARVVDGFSKTSDQMSAQDGISARKASVAPGSSPQVQQQLETMASELAIVRGLAEQLTVLQKKMAQDIAGLETAKENLGQKTWWLYQSSAFDAPPHKTAKKIAPSTAKSSPAPIPTTRPQTP
jgi:hypothetical protein